MNKRIANIAQRLCKQFGILIELPASMAAYFRFTALTFDQIDRSDEQSLRA